MCVDKGRVTDKSLQAEFDWIQGSMPNSENKRKALATEAKGVECSALFAISAAEPRPRSKKKKKKKLDYSHM